MISTDLTVKAPDGSVRPNEGGRHTRKLGAVVWERPVDDHIVAIRQHRLDVVAGRASLIHAAARRGRSASPGALECSKQGPDRRISQRPYRQLELRYAAVDEAP
jgi:hypothetical protein